MLTLTETVGGRGVCVGERSTPQWVANGNTATEAVRHDCVPVVSAVRCFFAKCTRKTDGNQ